MRASVKMNNLSIWFLWDLRLITLTYFLRSNNLNFNISETELAQTCEMTKYLAF